MDSGLNLIDSGLEYVRIAGMMTPFRWNQASATALKKDRVVFQHRWRMKTTTYHEQPGYEIDVILEGNPVLCIRGHRQELKPRDVVILRGDYPHGFEVAPEMSWVRTVVCFEPSFLKMIGDGEYAVQTWLGDKGYRHFSAGPTWFREMQGSFNRMHMEERMRGEFWMALFVGGLAAIWGRLRRYGRHPVYMDDQMPALIRRAMDYVHQDSHEELSLSRVSAGLRVSPEHLTRTFRQELGLSFGCFLRQTKLEQARKKMIEHPEQTLTEVALSAGFQDSSSFSRAFKRQYAQAPRDYRRQVTAGF